MDKKDYPDEALSLLADSNTYRTIPKDPTNKLRNKLRGILKDIKQTDGPKGLNWPQMCLTSAVPQRFMAFQNT